MSSKMIFSKIHDEYIRIFDTSCDDSRNFVLAISSQSDIYPGLYLTKYKVIGVDIYE